MWVRLGSRFRLRDASSSLIGFFHGPRRPEARPCKVPREPQLLRKFLLPNDRGRLFQWLIGYQTFLLFTSCRRSLMPFLSKWDGTNPNFFQIRCTGRPPAIGQACRLLTDGRGRRFGYVASIGLPITNHPFDALRLLRAGLSPFTFHLYPLLLSLLTSHGRASGLAVPAAFRASRGGFEDIGIGISQCKSAAVSGL